MARALSILVLALLAAPAAASADSCMCVPSQPAWDQPTWDDIAQEIAHPYALESVELGPFFSSDGTALSSRLDAVSPGQRPAPPVTVLWCASPDDPRCSGGEAPPERGPQASDASRGAAADPDGQVHLGPDRDGSTVTPTRGDGPRAGVSSRVDRPPQR